MKQTFVLIFWICTFSLFGQTYRQHDSVRILKDSIDFNLIEISKDNFETSKKSYKDEINYDSIKHRKTNGLIKLELNDYQTIYIKDTSKLLFNDTIKLEYHYIGQIDSINQYIISHDDIGVTGIYFVSKFDGNRKLIQSISHFYNDKDIFKKALPILSPNHKYLAEFGPEYMKDNWVTEIKPSIVTYNKTNIDFILLNQYILANNNSWLIRDITWNDKNELLLKVTKEYNSPYEYEYETNKNSNDFKYFIMKIK